MTRPRGHTLIEMLAVIGLLGLAAGLGAVGLSGATGRARIDRAQRDLRIAHVMARSLAMAGTPVSIALRAGSSTIAVHGRTSGELLWNRELPRGIAATFVGLDDQPRAELAFDSVGRCEDHEQILTRGGRVVSHLWISGVTGWTEPADGEVAP